MGDAPNDSGEEKDTASDSQEEHTRKAQLFNQQIKTKI